MAESKYIKKKSEEDQTQQAGPTAGKTPKATAGPPPPKQTDGIQIIIIGEDGKQKTGTLSKGGKINFAKGGRAGFRMGSKCKLAIKGKGRAYGKNS